VTSSFDTANRLTAMTDGLNHTVTYTLDADGERLTVTVAVYSMRRAERAETMSVLHGGASMSNVRKAG